MGNCFGGNATYGYPGYDQYGVPYGAGYGVDADPITPGIQATPGIVTPVGPPTVAGYVPPMGPMGGQFIGAIPPITTYAPPVSTYAPPVMTQPVIAPPIIPPPVMNSVAPMPVVPMASMTAIPPVMTAPVVTQPIINPMMNTNYAQQSMYSSPRFGVVDVDPITPGIQTMPGMIGATGPSYILGL